MTEHLSPELPTALLGPQRVSHAFQSETNSVFYDVSSSSSSSPATTSSDDESHYPGFVPSSARNSIMHDDATHSDIEQTPLEEGLDELDIVELKRRLHLLAIENQRILSLEAENSRLQDEKLQVTQELEELTRSLFEEANTLVASEAKARYLAELQVNKLQEELLDTKTRLSQELQQLEELKRKMEIISLDQDKRVTSLSCLTKPSLNLDSTLSIWNLFTPKELLEIAHPELSLSESKKIFLKLESSTEQNLTATADSGDVANPSKQEHVNPVNVGSPTLTKHIINDEWFYDYFEGPAFAEFVSYLGRPLNHLKRYSMSKESPSRASSSLLQIESGYNRSVESSTSLQTIGRSASPLLRPLTPNPFGTSFKNYITPLKGNTKPPNAAIYRSFPGEYKKAGDPFLKKVYEEDIYSTLYFPFKSRQFIKQILALVAANKITFEKMVTFSPEIVASVIASDPLSHSNSVSSPKGHTLCELCGKDISSPPPMTLELDKNMMSFGSLDTSTVSEAYKLVVEDSSLSTGLPKQTFLVDSCCRDKIVSVADFYTFIRYFKAGFYSQTSNQQLYIKWLHLKRNMFFARTGSLPYFVAHDVNKLFHLADLKLSPPLS